MAQRNKIIAITAGDPAGIGPEIVAKSIRKLEKDAGASYLIIGRKRDFAHCLEDSAQIFWCENESEAFQVIATNTFVGLDLTEVEDLVVETGLPSANSGKIAFKAIKTTVNLAVEKKVAGIATAPIAKDALKLAGYEFTGHTTIFKTLLNAQPVMTFYTPLHEQNHSKSVLVSLLSMHVPLMQVAEHLSPEKLEYVIKTTVSALQNNFSIENPRIAISGLNPHAGEGGMFGNEEIHIINPLIEKMQKEGLNVAGAIPPDTVFHRSFHKHEFDGVIALYHDQGLIAVKTFDFHNSVQMTLGLPFLRTSVDHGTAFDIAGKGIADINSMLNAITLAEKLIHRG
ncbi:MAG: 4-hydroxythreonine-4-phosphate dehydrogenase PdxA [Planctomycetes bacterium]|nr:4-hydroxythreonine-4-phosphate dehydrogenase PdxA [Planctomycetota bacterium]